MPFLYANENRDVREKQINDIPVLDVEIRSDCIREEVLRKDSKEIRFATVKRNQITISRSCIAHIFILLVISVVVVVSSSLSSLSFEHCFSHPSVDMLFVLPRFVLGYISTAPVVYTRCAYNSSLSRYGIAKDRRFISLRRSSLNYGLFLFIWLQAYRVYPFPYKMTIRYKE